MSNSSDSDSQTIAHDPMMTMLRSLERINKEKTFCRVGKYHNLLYLFPQIFQKHCFLVLVGQKGS